MLEFKPCEEKRQLHRAPQSDPGSDTKKDAYDSNHREVQKKLHIMQDTWLSNKANDIQGCADRHDMKHFCDSLKCVYGSPTSDSSPMLSADGATLITDKKIVEKWAEHFSDVQYKNDQNRHQKVVNRWVSISVRGFAFVSGLRKTRVFSRVLLFF